MTDVGGMRFLFTCLPAYGHLHAMMPYALALKQHGHQVGVVTGERLAPTIRDSGLIHFDSGISEASVSNALDMREQAAHAPPRARFKGAPPGVVQMQAFIERVAPLMWPAVQEVTAAWSPNVIVRAPLEFAGFFAAEKAGIPHVTIDWATHIPVHVFAGSALSTLATRFGLRDIPPQSLRASPLTLLASRLGLRRLVKNSIILDRHLVLSAMPPAWRYNLLPKPEVLFRHAVSPFDNCGSQSLPPWVADMSDLPLVYATLGTTFDEPPETFRAIIDALGAEPVHGILTIGPKLDPAAFSPLPANVRVERYIPQSLLLQRSSAMICHAGSNTLHGALWHGVPMVLMPQGAGDQSFNAKQAVARGVGVIPRRPFDAQSIRVALRKVLCEERFRMRSRELQSAMRALPPLSDALSRLEALAAMRTRQSPAVPLRPIGSPAVPGWSGRHFA